MQHYLIARAMVGDDHKPLDDLGPKGDSVQEVVRRWMACRADIFDVGLGHLRYALTEQDVDHLCQHLEKWLRSR